MSDTADEMKALGRALESYPVHLRTGQIYTQMQKAYAQLREQSIDEKKKALYATKSRKNPYTVMFKKEGENAAQLPYMKCLCCSSDDVCAVGSHREQKEEELIVLVAFKCKSCGFCFAIFFASEDTKTGTAAWVEPIVIDE